jgi:hypothetical protein
MEYSWNDIDSDLGSNPGLRGDRKGINDMRHDAWYLSTVIFKMSFPTC